MRLCFHPASLFKQKLWGLKPNSIEKKLKQPFSHKYNYTNIKVLAYSSFYFPSLPFNSKSYSQVEAIEIH